MTTRISPCGTDDGDPSFSPFSGRLTAPARPPMHNLPGTPAAVIERALACCTPVSCGYHLGNRRSFGERQDDWEEMRRGWSGIS